uniref:Uncharacterized protein n=1 Tax=Timema douglasi TaxID=61478 RepID=A0A7R8VHP4_TIMDO|nr:unnamed protein product [Timema douglasi]
MPGLAALGLTNQVRTMDIQHPNNDNNLTFPHDFTQVLKSELLRWSLEPGEKGVKSSWPPGPPSKCSGFAMCPLPHTLETLDVGDNRSWTNERSPGRYSRGHPSNHPKKVRAPAPKECRDTCVFQHGKCTSETLDEYRQANMYSRLRLSKVNKKYLSAALASLSQPTSVPENCLAELREKVSKIAVGLGDITKEEQVDGNENAERLLQWHRTKLNRKPPDKTKAHVSVVDLQPDHSSSHRAEQFCPINSWTRPHANLLKLKHPPNKVRSGPHASDDPGMKRRTFRGNSTLRESEWKSRKDCLDGSQQFGDVKQSITSDKTLERHVNVHDLIKGPKTYTPQKKESKTEENINLNQFTEDSEETILCNYSGHEVYTNDFKTMTKLENLFDKSPQFEINHTRQVNGNNLQRPILIGGKTESSTQYDKSTSSSITNQGEMRIDRESRPIVLSKDTQTLTTPIDNLEFIALKQLYKRYREETSHPKTFENTSHQNERHSNDHILDKSCPGKTKVAYELDLTENLSNLNQRCLSANRKQETSIVRTDSFSSVPQNKVIAKLPPESRYTSAKQVSLRNFSQKARNSDNQEQDQDEIRDGLCQEDEVRSLMSRLQINTARKQEYVQMKMLYSSAKAKKIQEESTAAFIEVVIEKTLKQLMMTLKKDGMRQQFSQQRRAIDVLMLMIQ